LLAAEALILSAGLATILLHRSPRAAGWSKGSVLVAWAFLPLVLAFAASYVVEPIFLDRYLLYVSLGLFLLIAFVIVRLPVAPPLRHALAIGLCALSLVTSERDPILRMDWRGASAQVRDAVRGGALTIIAPPHELLPLAYHLVPDAFRDQAHLVEALRAQNVIALPSLRDAKHLRVENVGAVLLVMTDAVAALNPELETWMKESGFQPTGRDTLTGLVLLRFALASRYNGPRYAQAPHGPPQKPIDGPQYGPQ
jgi:hypothetical protein